MAFSTNRLFKYQRGMRRRIGMLRAKNVDSMEFAVDFMMQERVDSYFRIEPGLEEVERSLQQIEEELELVRDVSGAIRLESRLEFVEDRWDELDSEVRERPRRRRRKINLADFPAALDKQAFHAIAMAGHIAANFRRAPGKPPQDYRPLPTPRLLSFGDTGLILFKSDRKSVV